MRLNVNVVNDHAWHRRQYLNEVELLEFWHGFVREAGAERSLQETVVRV